VALQEKDIIFRRSVSKVLRPLTKCVSHRRRQWRWHRGGSGGSGGGGGGGGNDSRRVFMMVRWRWYAYTFKAGDVHAAADRPLLVFSRPSAISRPPPLLCPARRPLPPPSSSGALELMRL